MTDAEKKMKRYVNAIERQLNLPREVKARVMSDLASSIAARREAGQSDEEIYTEFGPPAKAAADLNEQMKEFTYRKSPWRFAFAALAVWGGFTLLRLLIPQLMYWGFRLSALFRPEASSIGIIGGADGPTSIFVTSPASVLIGLYILLPLLATVVGIWGFLRLRKCRRK